MARRRLLFALCSLLSLQGLLVASGSAGAVPIVWSGPLLSFAKASGADFTLPANQDALTPHVILTRASTQGLFNIAQESSFSPTSPVDTLWATDLNNPGQTISAANFAALTFGSWSSAYNSSPSINTVGRLAVVHLVSDDIYLELRFTSFQGGTPGGAFSWQRTTPVPEPGSASLVLAVGAAAAALRTGPLRCGRKGTSSIRPR